MLAVFFAPNEHPGLTHHSTGPARKAAQSGEFKRYASNELQRKHME